MFDQKRRLNATQEKLVHRLMEDAGRDHVGIMDPLTQVFSRFYAESVIPKETSRVDRHGGPLCFLLAEVPDLRRLTERFGVVAADHVLLVTAQMLKKTLRGSDIICRYSGREFLVIMPDTRASQAQNAVRRLVKAIANWNETTQFDYKLELTVELADYRAGAEVGSVLNAARQRAHSLETAALTV